MSFIKFTKEEKTNFALIDKQHKHFVDLVNKLYSSSINFKFDDTDKLFNQLIEYLSFHFKTEEQLMQETKFEGYYSHKLEHDRFLRKLNKIYNSFIKNKFELDKDFFLTLKNWFKNHLELNDKKMGNHFVKMGIK
ncbi:MAG: hemerythrin family protein [Melioribacteraceae bacterium]|nr:hemerythrin family protein [Melioribacteraceae bacterium]